MRRLGLCLLVACASAAPARSVDAPSVTMPTPYRAREATAVSLNATCVGCHTEQAAAWSSSMHRHAFDNAAFQAALRVEPTPFCRGCHAPEANASAPTVAADLGVACVTCHVTAEGAVLAGPGTRSAPHALTRRAEFAGTASCASCHEFPFPGPPSFEDRGLMQTTMREHERVRSEQSCTSCHRSHAFREVREPTWLASQLRVSAKSTGETIRITLEQIAPGHAFPTGDLFRRLAVRVGDETRYLARHFEGRRELTRDDRVFDAPVTLDFPAPDAKEIAWSVTLERVAGIGTGSEPARATIESSVRLHEGVLVREPGQMEKK